MVNTIAPSTLLQAQSAYNSVNTQKTTLPPEASAVDNAVSFQAMVKQNFNSFASMKPQEVLSYINQVKASGVTNVSRDPVIGSVASLANSVRNDENVKRRAAINEASLSEVVAATAEAQTSLKTAVAVRNKVLKAFEEIMNMQI